MAPKASIQPSKQPRRPHYIREWAELAGYASQAELANALDADKSVVSRWYNGASPSLKMQQRLAFLFGCEPDALFRRPIDEWMVRVLQGRTADEVRRIKQILMAACPIDPDGGSR